MNFKTIMLLTLLISVIGCTSQSKDMFDENTPTTKNVMTGQYTSVSQHTRSTNSTDKMVLWSEPALSDYTRSQKNELDNIFPTYPNPTIYMYIDPHITKDGLPVPGYTTKFKMFTQEHYALPSELLSVR